MSYCAIADAEIAGMVRTVAAERPDAIILYCTDFPGAHLVAELEVDTGVPIYDSMSACVWKCLRLIGEPTSAGGRWGTLFTDNGSDATLVRGARVLTLDVADTEHAKADILIEGTMIAAIGPDLVAPGANVIDAAGLIAMPGLINGHFHSQVSLMAGSIPSRPLELFLLYEAPPLGDSPPDPRLIYLQTMLGPVEMLHHGVTTVHDDAFHNPWPTRTAIDAVMSAYRDSGLRATVAINHQNRPELEKLLSGGAIAV